MAKGWVRRVQATSNAMDIPDGLFTGSSRRIALGLRRAALASGRTKGTKFQSAMSMLNWFINRGGRGLSATRRAALERAKKELRKAFGKRTAGEGRRQVGTVRKRGRGGSRSGARRPPRPSRPEGRRRGSKGARRTGRGRP